MRYKDLVLSTELILSLIIVKTTTVKGLIKQCEKTVVTIFRLANTSLHHQQV